VLKNAQKVTSTTPKPTLVTNVMKPVLNVLDHIQMIAQNVLKDYYYTKVNALKPAQKDSSLITKPEHVILVMLHAKLALDQTQPIVPLVKTT
jgi:hypothetical protein